MSRLHIKYTLSFFLFCCCIFPTTVWSAAPVAKFLDVPRIAKFTIQSPKCHGLAGSIVIDSVMGGQAPFRFSIDGESYSTDPIIKNIFAGDYVLFVKDKNEAVSDTIFIMTEPAEFSVKIKASANPIRPNMPLRLEAILSPTTVDLEKITWRPQQLFNNENTLVQVTSLKETENFYIKVYDNNGCTATDYLTIKVDKHLVFAPNALSPDADQNAYFTLYSAGLVERVKSLRIFNRWGIEVFEKENFPPNDPLQGWDGRIENKRASPGVYLYSAEVVYIDGTIERISGDVAVFYSN